MRFANAIIDNTLVNATFKCIRNQGYFIGSIKSNLCVLLRLYKYEPGFLQKINWSSLD